MRKHYALIFGYEVVSIWAAKLDIQGSCLWFHDSEDKLIAGFVAYSFSNQLSRVEVYNNETDKFEIVWQKEPKAEETKEAVEV